MNAGQRRTEDAAALRRRAELQWAATRSPLGSTTDADAARLIQELQVHQIELELQQEELRAAQLETDVARARFADLFDHAPMGYVVVDRNGVVREANLVAQGQLGEAASVRGRALALAFTPESRLALARLLAAVFASGRPQHADLLAVLRDGRRRELHVEGIGDASECRLSLVDVTERRRQEATVQRLEEALRASQRMESIGRLAGGIAHDFNNLLTVIRSSARLLQDEVPVPGPAAELVTEILDAGQRAAELTAQLLAFSRRQPVVPQAVAVNAVVIRVERLLHRLLGPDHHLRLDLASVLPQVLMDPMQLEQVLLNLVVNARDAMPHGGELVVGTAVARLADGRAAVEVRVADTGEGIAPELQVTIFEPFFTTKGVGKGTGLGLAVVHGIMQEAGGEISLQSAPGAGAVFRCRLPVLQPS